MVAGARSGGGRPRGPCHHAKWRDQNKDVMLDETMGTHPRIMVRLWP